MYLQCQPKAAKNGSICASKYNTNRRDQKCSSTSDSTYKTEQKNDSSYKTEHKNDSTYNRSLNNDISYNDYSMKFITFIDSLKKISTYKENDIDELSLLLAKARILWGRLSIGTINQKEKRQLVTVNKKLMNLIFLC